ncbi:site-specific integrase [Thalassospira sp. MCCC 1A01428]|uniref:site-specific integrase n=1 Tax=Thalassospira sp. MCCC 1A01428 TaxID=1470575 RepID=UPI000A2191C0|nr:site-specific integrase [Thalassospira sp. MCCC 1A01428]OSQ33640.1 hypothetical protein THS27_26055 [Thalassospira sp. MCCC 1A01428]
MPAIKQSLSNTLCKTLDADPAGDLIIWDTQVKGLFFKITPANNRTFGLYYRTATGQQRRPKLGDFGPLKVPSARAMAEDWLAQVHQGGDPASDRTAQRRKTDQITVADLAERYLADHVDVKRKAGQSRENDRILLSKHILPAIGKMPVKDVEHDHVFRLHRKMQDKYTVNGNRALACMSKMFNLAELWKMRPLGSNPCRFVSADREDSRERDLQDNEWSALAKALDEYEKYQIGNVAICWLIRLCIFTGARRGEIMNAPLSAIDAKRQVLVLGDHKTATTRRSVRNRSKTIVLNSYALQVIKDRLDHPDHKSNPWLIPGRTRNDADGNPLYIPMNNPIKAWKKIKDMAGISDLRLNDLRHAFATMGIDHNVPMEHIQKLLGHTKIDTTMRYAHRRLEIQRREQDIIADAIAAKLKTG